LGFEHEWMRPDWTSPCDFEAPNLSAGWDSHGTSPDVDSIMASTYCSTRTVLSAGDVSGLQNAYGSPGKLQIHAVATDSGLDTMWHRWTGTTWQWQELFKDQDDLRTRPALASIRTGATEVVRSFNIVGTNLLADTWNGSVWNRQKWTNKVVDLPPA